MDWSMPGFLVLHQLLELAQTHIHWISDAIKLFCPLSSPSPPSLNLSQHQVFIMSWLFTWGGQSIRASGSILLMNSLDWFPLGLTGLISLQSKGLSRIFCNTTIQKHQLFSIQPYLWSNSHIHTWLLEKPQLWLGRHLLAKWCLCFLISCLGLS